MSRSARLLDLVQTLRRHRRPVTAAHLADELGTSLRTIYRDIDTLRGQGAPIEGEAGVGYVLKPGFVLPPLMFGVTEVDALILGLRLVGQRGDPDLARAAEDALAKIVAVLPREMEDLVETSGLLAGPANREAKVFLSDLREAIRSESKVRLCYTDRRGVVSERVVWPVALGFFEAAAVLAAWCEARGAFRHFRLDRIGAAEALGQRYPTRRRVLLAERRLQEGIDPGG